jgi:dTDP-4-dehydrorhamnose 3,5-epimerase
MKICVVPTAIDRLLIVETEYFHDDRGFFIEAWHQRHYADQGLEYRFVQDNHSRSGRGVLRGLHYQDMTAPMAKLVRCTRGAVLDVAVDLRVGSPTFGRHLAVELSDQNMRQVLVPAGFAHGFLTLSEEADVQYKCSGFYAPAAEGALLWNDPELEIAWPVAEPLLSEKDRRSPSLRDYLERPAFRYQDVLASVHG